MGDGDPLAFCFWSCCELCTIFSCLFLGTVSLVSVIVWEIRFLSSLWRLLTMCRTLHLRTRGRQPLLLEPAVMLCGSLVWHCRVPSACQTMPVPRSPLVKFR